LELTAKASLSPKAANDNVALGSLWARSKVESLERDLWNGPDQKVIDKITQVGLQHRLVTAYTSFVAVDYSSTVNGKLQTVMQPAHAPEGVDLEMAGGEYTKNAPAKGAKYKMLMDGSGAGSVTLGGGAGGNLRSIGPSSHTTTPAIAPKPSADADRFNVGDR